MRSISITTILLLVVAVLCGDCEACDCPLEIKRKHDDHYTVIQCSYSGTGTDVENAIFFRNELDMDTDDCLRDTFVSYDQTNSMLKLKPVSLCDGFYACGKDSDLSEPLAIHSKPVQNGPGNGKNIEITLEEGANKTLPCYISTSPINTQITTWYNGMNELEDHNKDESSYRIVNAAMGVHNGLYWCSVESVTFKFQDKPVVDSNPNGTFKVTVVKKFTPATFTESLTYTIDDEGTAHFSSSAKYNEEYRVNYQWYINDSVDDSDELSQTGKLQFELGKIANHEETKVRVVIWNTKYDNVNHSDSQTITIHWNLHPPSSIRQDNDAWMIGFIVGVAVFSAVVLIFLAVILFLSKKLYIRGKQPASKSVSNQTIIKSKCECQQTKQPTDVNEKSSVHSDLGNEFLNLLNKVVRHTRDNIEDGYKLDNLIFICLRELLESIYLTSRINIDEKTTNILETVNKTIVESINTNGIKLDGDCCQDKCIQEKDISNSKLIINQQQLVSEILQNIEKKLEQFRQKDGNSNYPAN